MEQSRRASSDENKPHTIRKKSSFLRDGSYRIFHITKKPTDNSDDDDASDSKNTDQMIEKRNSKSQKNPLKIANRSGLKQLLFIHRPSRDSTAIEMKTPPLERQTTFESTQSTVSNGTAPVKSSNKTKQQVQRQSTAGWCKTNTIDETLIENCSVTRTEKVESTNRKQVMINIHPELQTSFHRRQKRFIVACGTVLIAMSIIITIIVYVIIMTIRHKKRTNQNPRY